MFWALASSVFVIYLYRKLNAQNAPAVEDTPDDSVEAELADLTSRIAALEAKLGAPGAGVPKS